MGLSHKLCPRCNGLGFIRGNTGIASVCPDCYGGYQKTVQIPTGFNVPTEHSVSLVGMNNEWQGFNKIAKVKQMNLPGERWAGDFPKENKMPKTTTMTRRYYATSSAIEYNKLLGTLSEAMADADKKLRETNSKANKLGEIYIVEVVRLVRFESNPEDKPIEVIEVRR